MSLVLDNPAKDLLTTAEVAKLIGLTTASIRRLAIKGILKPIKRQGQTQIFKRSDVLAVKKDRPKVGNPNWQPPI